MFKLNCLVVSTLTIGLASLTQAASYSWTDWTSAQAGMNGSAQGQISFPGQTVNVTYGGEIQFANTNGGTNYWTPSSIYTSSSVSNGPASSDGIFLQGGYGITQTLTFSKPVLNPSLTILSLGRPTMECRYAFNKPFNIASQGQGYWGGSSSGLTQSGNTLIGNEGHGTIVFPGVHSSLTWTVPYNENWHGFQVGAMRAVPEPASMAALGLGLAALIRRRKNRS